MHLRSPRSSTTFRRSPAVLDLCVPDKAAGGVLRIVVLNSFRSLISMGVLNKMIKIEYSQNFVSKLGNDNYGYHQIVDKWLITHLHREAIENSLSLIPVSNKRPLLAILPGLYPNPQAGAKGFYQVSTTYHTSKSYYLKESIKI